MRQFIRNEQQTDVSETSSSPDGYAVEDEETTMNGGAT
jgi:hypothetical protein